MCLLCTRATPCVIDLGFSCAHVYLAQVIFGSSHFDSSDFGSSHFGSCGDEGEEGDERDIGARMAFAPGGV